MTNTDTIDAYRVRLEAGDRTAWLGRLVWYSVSDARVDHATVVRSLLDAGITTALPRYPEDVDVFDRVCSSAQRKRGPTRNPDQFVNYLVRRVGRDTRTATRRVVAEVVDPRGRRLGYEQLWDVVFHRDTATIEDVRLGRGVRDAQAVVEDIRRQYELWRGCLNGWAVREWIRRFLVALGATQVRPGGGVYFVRESAAAAVAALETFASLLPEGVEVHSLPLLDDAKQRAMVRRAFAAETADAVDQLLGEIRAIRASDRRISDACLERFVQRSRDLAARTGEYATVLEDSLAETRIRLEAMQKALLRLAAENLAEPAAA